MDKHTVPDGEDAISKVSGPGRWLSVSADVTPRFGWKTSGWKKAPETYEEFIAEAYAREYGTGLVSEDVERSAVEDYPQYFKQPRGHSKLMYWFLLVGVVLFGVLTVAGITLLIYESQVNQNVNPNYIIIFLAGFVGSIVSGGSWCVLWYRRKLHSYMTADSIQLEDAAWRNTHREPTRKKNGMTHISNQVKRGFRTLGRDGTQTRDKSMVHNPQDDASGASRIMIGTSSGRMTRERTQEAIPGNEPENIKEDEFRPTEETGIHQITPLEYRISIGPSDQLMVTAQPATPRLKDKNLSDNHRTGQVSVDTSDLWPKPLDIRKKRGIGGPQQLSNARISEFEPDERVRDPITGHDEDGRRRGATTKHRAYGPAEDIQNNAEIESAYQSHYAPSDASYKGPRTESVFKSLPLISNRQRTSSDADSRNVSILSDDDEKDHFTINHGKFSDLASNIGSQKRSRSLRRTLNFSNNNAGGKSMTSSLAVGPAGSSSMLPEPTNSSVLQNRSPSAKETTSRSNLRSEAVEHFSRHFSAHPEDATRDRFEQLFREYLDLLRTDDMPHEQSQRLADSTWDEIQCLVFESSPDPTPEEARFSGVTLQGQLDLRQSRVPDNRVRQEMMDPVDENIHPLLRDELKRWEKEESGKRLVARDTESDEVNESSINEPAFQHTTSPALPPVTRSSKTSHLSMVRDSSTLHGSESEDVASSSQRPSPPPFSPLRRLRWKHLFMDEDSNADQSSARSSKHGTIGEIPIEEESNDHEVKGAERPSTGEAKKEETPKLGAKPGQDDSKEQRKSVERKYATHMQEQDIEQDALKSRSGASTPVTAGLADRAPSLSSLKLKITDPRSNARIYPPRNDSLPGSPAQAATSRFRKSDTQDGPKSPTEIQSVANPRFSLYSIAESLRSSAGTRPARAVPDTKPPGTQDLPSRRASQSQKTSHVVGEYSDPVSSGALPDPETRPYYKLTAKNLEELRRELQESDPRVPSSSRRYDALGISYELLPEPSYSPTPISKSLPNQTGVANTKIRMTASGLGRSSLEGEIIGATKPGSRSDGRSLSKHPSPNPDELYATAVMDWAEDATRGKATEKKQSEGVGEYGGVEALPRLAGKGPGVRRGSKRNKMDVGVGSLHGLSRELATTFSYWVKNPGRRNR